MSLSPEEIDDNWKKFVDLCKKTGDRSPAVINMVESLGMRLATCPASSKTDYHSSYPGGLIDHSLRVFKNAFKLTQAFGWEIPRDSLILATLFHDLGKVGDHENDYYVAQTDSWRVQKLGEEYTHNKQMKFMTVNDRSVWLFAHYGIKLTQDEFLAIKLNDGQYINENAQYKLKEPLLAMVVHMADLIATKQEKEQIP